MSPCVAASFMAILRFFFNSAQSDNNPSLLFIDTLSSLHSLSPELNSQYISFASFFNFWYCFLTCLAVFISLIFRSLIANSNPSTFLTRMRSKCLARRDFDTNSIDLMTWLQERVHYHEYCSISSTRHNIVVNIPSILRYGLDLEPLLTLCYRMRSAVLSKGCFRSDQLGYT